jgi:hypothetical protein
MIIHLQFGFSQFITATAGLSLTVDPMGNMFQNPSSMKPLGQLKPNCPAMIIGSSSTKFLFLCRSEIQDGRQYYTPWSEAPKFWGPRLQPIEPIGKSCTAYCWADWFQLFKWFHRRSILKHISNTSSMKPLGQLKPNSPAMIIGSSSTKFLFLCRSEIQDGRHRRT